VLFGYFRQLEVGLLFLIKCQCQKIDQLFFSNYSPPFWEILLDTVTAESPTGEG
jgi:hypothetical protein